MTNTPGDERKQFIDKNLKRMNEKIDTIVDVRSGARDEMGKKYYQEYW